ncbi:MAG: Crp/Fnr family transcriptional regulator [Parvularculaceae bacterium]|nr:Crp/Fnr family transcriptional regulator [Parvularculaceae bacterium]
MAGPSKAVEKSYLSRIIENAELFRTASADDLAELARNAKVTAIQRGKPVASKVRNREIFVVETGAVAALDHDPAGDKTVLIALYGPGAVAGLAAAAEGAGAEHRLATRWELRALSNATVISLPAADFLRVARRSPELTAAWISALGGELASLSARLTASLHSPLETRLAAFFAELATILSGNLWEPAVNIGRLPQTVLADFLGVSREHVNRTLIMWERSGLILQSKGGEIVIENRKRLEQIVRARRAAEDASIENEWIWEIQAHLDHGINDTAFDLAMEGVRRSPRDDRFKYFAALAMARMGALKEAVSLVESFKLTTDAPNEDIASIGPKLRRDLAFASSPVDKAMLAEAADGYAKVFRALKTTYPGVNAASTAAMIGETERARTLAREVRGLAAASLDNADDREPSYWSRATIAECRLIEGDLAVAAADFSAAVRAFDAAPGMIGTTRKQLKRLKSCTPIDDAWIDRAAPQAGVLYFCGPLIPPGVDDNRHLDRLRRRVDAYLEGRRFSVSIGALAAGADIVIAEALLDAGVSLHVHLPIAPPEFLAASVEPSGGRWRERFIACVERAQTIDWTRRAACSRAAYRLGSRIGIGRVIRLAEEIDGQPFGYFALQEGRSPADSISWENASVWRALGLAGEFAEDDWLTVAPASNTDHASDFYSALIVEGENADVERLRPLFTVSAGAFHCLAFDSAAAALEGARAAATSAGTAKSRLWLDVGSAEAGDETARSAFPSTLITAASKPLTAPGKAFASESFVNVAASTPGCPRPFEYVGVTPTEEKLDPCPLYLVDL